MSKNLQAIGTVIDPWMRKMERRVSQMETQEQDAMEEDAAASTAVEEDFPRENNASLTGKLATVPRMRTVKGGQKMASFILAVPRVGKGVDFVPVAGFGAIAEQCEPLGKGSAVHLQGRINRWKTKTGKYDMQVLANVIQVLSRQPAAQANDAPKQKELALS